MREQIRYFAAESGNPCIIEMIGQSWCDGTYRITREKSSIWVMEYILAGRGTIKHAGSLNREYYPETGDVYLLPPGNKQDYYSDAQEPWNKIFVNCKGPVIDGLADAYGLSEQILFSGMQELEKPFRHIYECAENKSMPQEQAVKRVELLVHEIFRTLGRKYQQARQETEEIRRVRQYLDSHVGQLVTIQEIAGLIYRSPDYLIKHFKAENGVTPYQYLLKRKMQIAERLLRDTVIPISEVAEQLGYEDAHYFSGLFKKEKGITPGQFRRNFRKN